MVINSHVTNHLLLWVKEYIYLSSASFNLNIVSVNKNSHPLLFCLGIDKWGCYTNKIANAWTFLRSNCELVFMFEIRLFCQRAKAKEILAVLQGLSHLQCRQSSSLNQAIDQCSAAAWLFTCRWYRCWGEICKASSWAGRSYHARAGIRSM